jgi:hypothetical protein
VAKGKIFLGDALRQMPSAFRQTTVMKTQLKPVLATITDKLIF